MDTARIQLIVILAFFVFACSSFDKQEKCYHSFSVPSMGTVLNVKWVNACNYENKKQIQLKVKLFLENLESELSTYQSDSKISLLNKNGYVKNVSIHFLQLLDTGAMTHQKTNGYFNPLIMSVLDAYKNVAKKNQSASKVDFKKYRPLLQMSSVVIKGKNIKFKKPKMKITFDGIAKGYAIDLVGDIFESFGINDYLIDFSGNILARGNSINSQGWKIYLTRDRNETFDLNNQCVSTSGSRFNYFELNNQKISHIVNPISLKPIGVEHKSITVLGVKGVLCDVLSTALATAPLSIRQDVITHFPGYRIIR